MCVLMLLFVWRVSVYVCTLHAHKRKFVCAMHVVGLHPFMLYTRGHFLQVSPLLYSVVIAVVARAAQQ